MRKTANYSDVALIVILLVIMNFLAPSSVKAEEKYDIAVIKGRVMDPLTRTDVTANVGIKDGKIAAIVPAQQELRGEVVIDASGLVVAPGFINMHSHGSGVGRGSVFAVLDGITTDITGNCGDSGAIPVELAERILGSANPIEAWFSKLEQKGLLKNLASYAGHNTLRAKVGLDALTPANEGQRAKMIEMLRQDMKAGAIGISFGPFYGPGATFEEMVALGKEAALMGGCAATHIRHSDPMRGLKAIEEAINTARKADIPLIISHMGPVYGPTQSGAALEMLQEAREQGFRIATTCHPYDSFQVMMLSPIFDTPLETLFKVFPGMKISDLLNPAEIKSGEKVLMKAGDHYESNEQFNDIRRRAKAGEIPDPAVIGLNLYKHYKTFLWYSYPFTMMMNDSSDMDVTDYQKTGRVLSHPKGAGSFARFLGHFVRERGVCDLMTALAKTSTMAALWLGLDRKGRIQVGRDADLTLFDPQKIIDRGTYVNPDQAPAGIPYVIINGILAVDKGNHTGKRPGKIIRRTWNIPGALPPTQLLPGKGVESIRGTQ